MPPALVEQSARKPAGRVAELGFFAGKTLPDPLV
jgi:hypothetical protein